MKYLNTFVIVLFIICSAETCSKKEPLPPITPIADFTFELGKNGEVRFKNASINAIKYSWDFGDGKTSVDESPTHFYEDEKEFTVKLMVNSKDNQINSISKKINIDSYEPIPDFKVELLEAGKIKITNLSKFASIYTWTIDDKSQKNNQTEFEYLFKTNGKYSITLNAEKANGLSRKVTKEILIDNIESVFLRCKGTITYSNFEKKDHEIELRSSDSTNVRIPFDLSFLPTKEIKFKLIMTSNYILLVGNGQGIITGDKISFAYVDDKGTILFDGLILK